jgi:AraC-like DNA-binding protein
MDPLSDVLALLKLRSYSSRGFDAAGDWSVAFGLYEGIKFYAVVSGECWLALDGESNNVHLRAGDCFLLTRALPFRVASDLTLDPMDARTVLQTIPEGGILSLNGGGDCFIVGGHFALADTHAGMLLAALPPVMLIQKESDQATLRWCLERMSRELREPQAGGFLVAQQLALMVLVQVLRLHLADGLKGGVGWYFALADKQMAAALTAMHGNPARRWTLQSLAESVGMSRTTFTLKFKRLVGESPIEYLTRWRMLLASDRLTNSSDPISVVALSLSYESESAFSAAFRRIMGCSPREYTRNRFLPIRSPLENDGLRSMRRLRN